MKPGAARPASWIVRATGGAAACLLAASCTGAGLADLEVGNPKFALPDPTASSAAAPADAIVPLTTEQEADIGSSFMPAAKPQRDAAAAATEATVTPQATMQSFAAPAAVSATAPATTAPAQSANPPAAESKTADASVEAQPQAVASYVPPPPPPKKGFLAGLFSAKPQDAPVMSNPASKPKPLVALASATPSAKPSPRAALEDDDRGPTGGADLPGVRRTSLFEIKRKDSIDDDSDVDVHEDEESPVQYASAAGMGRLAPNGLLTQRESVDVSCLKPSLVRMLKQIERHFGKRIVVTSGYRSPEYNRKVRGARRSMHMFCAAVDVQLDGIGKLELARYARAMPGRGGVGTYCHTNSVHIDVGPERDWNWRCRTRKRRS